MEYGRRSSVKDLQREEFIPFLRKVFTSSSSVKEEDLEFFIQKSEKVDAEEMYTLLLEVGEQMEEKELLRILKLLPQQHKLYLEVFLPLGSLLHPTKAKLYSLFLQSQANKKRVR